MDKHHWLRVVGKVAKKVAPVARVATEVMVSKSGILESQEARRRRMEDGRLISVPRVGTPLLVTLAGLVEHSGIYLGRSRVAELNGNGRLLNVSLSEFINGQEDERLNLRLGTRIFAACDAVSGLPLGKPGIARTARKLIEDVGEVRYNLFANNCHLFTASCILGGMSKELSFVDWLRDGTFSIERLGIVISANLNDEKPIAWLGVEGPSRRFQYELTAAKVAALHNEDLSQSLPVETT